ncbi:lysophospholipid acyltransferase family protein [Enterovirga sp.]|uniref:lysophospholipid acyltransferase family protein n=1 Tax=Enterovirga sp. TaxID=2026350 RepID=UPI00262998A5|nr:lysophospholipid acyltransferase family protein [Enterovirga sp.]
MAPVQLAATRGTGRLAGRLPVLFHRLFLRVFGIRVTVRGEPPAGPTLVLANHVSWLDVPVIASLRPLSFIAKQEISAWPVVGGLSRLQRCIFLDRSRKVATAEVNALVAGRLAAGDAIVLFPEGTTGDGLRLLPFRSSLVGAARAALADPTLEAICLQPLAIAYTARNGLPVSRRDMPDIAWYGDMDLKPHLSGFVRHGPIDVTVVWGEPIPFDAATDRKRATAAAEASVRAALQAVRNVAAVPAAAPPILLRPALS